MRPALGLGLLVALAGELARAGTATLLIDDLGYDRALAHRALSLPPPVAVAVLPDAPHSEAIARAARRTGTDVLLHLPMQAEDVAPRAGTLRVGMAADTYRSRVSAALASVPGAVGVNNHMGSALTARRGPMRRFMRELAGLPRRLVFIDSRTTPDSRAVAAARAAGVGVARRDVFIDHVREPAAIAGQVRRWLEQARRAGCSLAIAHPYPETFRILERVLPRADDVRRVGVERYIEECGGPASPRPPAMAASGERRGDAAGATRR